MTRYLFVLVTIVASAAECVCIDAEAAERIAMIWPAPLRPGDAIMFVSPAGPPERDQVMTAKRRFEQRGYRVKMRDDMFDVEGYLAGSDQRRADELMQAFLDPQVKAVLATRGGYGAMRMLDRLDYAKIRANPKFFAGYSDITAMHAAFNRLAGLVTFHGPGPASGLGRESPPPDFTAKYFFRAVEGVDGARRDGYAIEVPADAPQVRSLGKGKARGRLVGGNLSLVAALEGTPYAIDAGGAILLIEDVSEAPYRIDRMLRTLKLAGKLSQLKGAVLGQFTKPDEREESPTADARFSIEGVLQQYFADAGIPVLMNFPVGHPVDAHSLNCTLPLGGDVEIDADARTLRVMEAERIP